MGCFKVANNIRDLEKQLKQKEKEIAEQDDQVTTYNKESEAIIERK